MTQETPVTDATTTPTTPHTPPIPRAPRASAGRTPASGQPPTEPPEGGRDLGSLASDLRLACMRISRRVRFEHVDGAGEGGPTLAPHRFSVLARLEGGPLPVTRLADIERVSAPSMTRTVGGLVDDGLATRADNPQDRRQVVVAMTDAGRDLVAATRARRDLWVSSRIGRLSDAERAVLAAAAPILSKVADL